MMVGRTDPTWAIVKWGLISEETYTAAITPFVDWLLDRYWVGS